MAHPLFARTDLPPFDTAAMDGWAVAGSGPWRVTGELLAGAESSPLGHGEAVSIATGAVLPHGAIGVLRQENGFLAGVMLTGRLSQGKDFRPRGQECSNDELILSAGTRLTPAAIALAAAAGHDDVDVIRAPRVDLLVLGEELLDGGQPRHGRIRDALGPMIPACIAGLGAAVDRSMRVEDSADALLAEAAASTADVIVTTGGTGFGVVDHVHAVLEALGATKLVDGVQVRPGHPMLLARLPSGQLVVGLPGNPLAAMSGVLTMLAPVTGALRGEPPALRVEFPIAEDVMGHPQDTCLIPVCNGAPLDYTGPAMLRGLAAADAMAVAPPGGVVAGELVEILPLPW